jgi:hypothetical protein
MKPTDDEPNEPMLDEALARLVRPLEPSAGYEERVLRALRAEGLVRPAARAHRGRMLRAALWFIAGVGTGAVARATLERPDPPPDPLIASVRAPDAATSIEPVEWY